MDKRLILAVAGAGKTTEIINNIKKDDKTLIITYTENNCKILKNDIIKKFKGIPDNIKIYTYFTFLYRFCFLPLKKGFKVQGLDYNRNNLPKGIKAKDINYYYNPESKKMYSNRLAKLCSDCFIDDIIKRIEKYFNYIYIDEIQDFASHDFNLLLNLIKTNCNILLVGDFYQHTFDTSTDGNTNKNLYNDYDNFINKIKNSDSNIKVDTVNFLKSKRCSKQVCEFITECLKIKIESWDNHDSTIIEIDDENAIEEIVNNDNIVKLFYKDSKKYDMKNKDNWGNSKGSTYINTCVVLNKNSYEKYKNRKLNELTPNTKNKLYVALSRAEKNVYIINEKYLDKYKKMNG